MLEKGRDMRHASANDCDVAFSNAPVNSGRVII